MGMTGTRRFLTRMALFIILVAALAGALFPVLELAFLANTALNGVIVGTLLFGVVFILRQVLMLNPEIAWLEGFARGQSATTSISKLRLLGPMATMLGERKGRLALSPNASRALLDSIGSRLDEARDIARYMIGLLILLGLLGTFWGLIKTVGSVGDVVGKLSLAGGDPVAAFDDLKRGLATPLAAMGLAFSSSLFGLAGSLILGFLDLQAGQAQNRFYNEFEEWLSSVTKLGGGGAGAVADGEQSVPAFIQALLEQTADSLDNLQRIMSRGEESRIASNNNLTALTERLSTLTDQMRTEQTLMMKLAESQVEMKPILAKLSDRLDASAGDDVSRAHLRSIDTALARLVEEAAQGRTQIVQDMRGEIRLLARTIAALAEEESR